MRSKVTAITPETKGVHASPSSTTTTGWSCENTSGKPVVVDDYRDKPYARVLGDGTVQVNTNSEAYYLNDDRYGDVKVPDGLGAQPKWKTLSRSGRFEWHDHRMHWMGQGTPPQVSDKDKKTHIFDWKVPVTIGGTAGHDRRNARLGAAARRIGAARARHRYGTGPDPALRRGVRRSGGVACESDGSPQEAW